MDETLAKSIADQTIGTVFGYQNPYNLELILEKFAFDIRLPKQVKDSTTGESTWAQSAIPDRFITLYNANVKADNGHYHRRISRQFNSIEDVLKTWSEINEMTTERQLDSTNIYGSDNVYESSNVYRSQDIGTSSNVLFSDGLSANCHFVIGCQRSKNLRNCIRVEDSKNCNNSFSIIWSQSINNSMFINDAKNVSDSLFCSHISNVRFCVANVQLTEAEYLRVREMVVHWILTG